MAVIVALNQDAGVAGEAAEAGVTDTAVGLGQAVQMHGAIGMTDEYLLGRIWWPYYGLELPDDLLKSLYRDNALKLLNWTKP